MPALGQGLLLGRRARPPAGPSRQGSDSRHRSQGAGRPPAAARHPAADPAPLHRHPQAPRSARSTTPSRPPSHEHDYQGKLLLRLPDQGEPAAAGRRGGPRLRQAVSTSAWRPARKPELLAVLGAWPTTTRRSSATASRTTSSSRWRCWPSKIGRKIIPVVEKYTELELIAQVRRASRRPPGHRRARQAGQPRLGPLAIVRRLPLEVRPDGDRGAARLRVPEAARHGRLPPAAALPPRQPDHQHPQHQGRADRGGPRLRRAAPRRAPGSSYLDVGGGLGIDYDGSQTDFESSASTTRCRNTPTTSSSTSRASATRPACRTRPSSPRAAAPVVAYHSVLVFNVLGALGLRRRRQSRRKCRPTSAQPLVDLFETYRGADAARTCSRATTTRSRRSTRR